MGPAAAILDGDQEAASQSHVKRFLGLVGKSNDDQIDWIKSRLTFLPGSTSPERYVLAEIRSINSDVLASWFRTEAPDEIISAIDNALLIGDHNELYEFSNSLNYPEQAAWLDCCKLLESEKSSAIAAISKFVAERLATGD